MYPNLLSAIKIRGLELRNRVVYPAMGTKMATADKFVTEQLINDHLARVQGGSGLNILEVSSVLESASPSKFVSIAHDRYLPMLTRFNEVLHEAGGATGVQLWLGGVAVASDPTARRNHTVRDASMASSSASASTSSAPIGLSSAIPPSPSAICRARA